MGRRNQYKYHLVANASNLPSLVPRGLEVLSPQTTQNVKAMTLPRSLLVTLAALQGVHGWGVLGHATVAYVAQHYLTADTASWLVYLNPHRNLTHCAAAGEDHDLKSA